MLGTTQLTLARCVKFVLRDGTELGFTDHDRDLVVPLDVDLYDPVTYRAGFGMIVGDMSFAVGLEADNTEMSFPIAELITRRTCSRAGSAWPTAMFSTSTGPSPPAADGVDGRVHRRSAAGKNMAVFEVRSNADRWNTVIGRLAAPRCSADFGDAASAARRPRSTPRPCRIALQHAVPGRSRGEPRRRLLPVRHGRVHLGRRLAARGRSRSWPSTAILQEVEVLSPMPGFAEVGDAVLLRDGCSRVKKADDPTVPTCLTHNNVLRFRGLDQMPGTDRYVRFPIPGTGETR
jgi:hypothetical protein